MHYAQNILDLIGDTPLVKLNRVTVGIDATVLVKVEYLNPGGSAKDRIAVRIIDAAEKAGLLKPGGTIVEPTSGNTGVGLALVAQQRGYRCVFVCPDKVGEDKINVLKAYGAEVVMTPTSVAPDSPESYYSVSDRLVEEIPGAFKPDQYSNPNGPASHYASTGPEIWADTAGKVTHFVAGVGTGGTITGTGRYLKEVSGGRVQVIGADPEGSVYSGGTGRPYLTEGVGEDMWPDAYDPSVPDEILSATDAESFEVTRRLAREEGLLLGGSSGLAVACALKKARTLTADDVVVVLLPDGGRGYLGKIFNDDWMKSYGFLPSACSPDEPGHEVRVSDIIAPKPDNSIYYVRKEATIGEAIAEMNTYGVDQLVVLQAEPPVVIGEVAGAIDERRLTEALFAGDAKTSDPISELNLEPLPLIGAKQCLREARDKLSEANALLVIDDATPVGVLTRHDLLTYGLGRES
ncbi:cystathionine beta-synthase [Sediminivirga luteola]|nr:cystathionine beta-synthase [Sediminivirga luteola]MCI2265900.1 cystathionine beta-synthase [Sediminivirga luteola]